MTLLPMTSRAARDVDDRSARLHQLELRRREEALGLWGVRDLATPGHKVIFLQPAPFD
jgi:hypothetical protein